MPRAARRQRTTYLRVHFRRPRGGIDSRDDTPAAMGTQIQKINNTILVYGAVDGAAFSTLEECVGPCRQREQHQRRQRATAQAAGGGHDGSLSVQLGCSECGRLENIPVRSSYSKYNN